MAEIRGSILGHPVARKEDPALLTGARHYTGDLPLPGGLVATFVRSPIAHARITGIDPGDAVGLPGVVAVHTAATLGLAPVPGPGPTKAFARPPLADGVVRFVGEPVAVVVATSLAAAVDGAEQVVVDYDPLPVVVDVHAARADGAPLVHAERGTNVMASLAPRPEDDLSPDELFADAEVVVSGRFVNQRVAAVPIEGNAVAAVPRADGGVDVWVSTQTPHDVKAALVGSLGLEPHLVRVVAPAVGGGFGAKIGCVVEHLVVARLARLLGAPVRWVEDRTEHLQAFVHGRAQHQDVRLGLRRDGTITALDVRIHLDAGAYPTLGALLTMQTRRMAQGTYRIPKVRFESVSMATNTTPVAPFRGAGRPEATALIERAMDLAARELGLDPADIRRRNLIRPDEFPFATQTGVVMDVGDYPMALDRALELSGYDELRATQARRRDAGDPRLLGIGVSCYVEITAGLSTEWSSVTIEADGGATVRVGTASHGQGHDTTFSMLVSDRLGIPVERVRVIHSDTDEVPSGFGTMGSRSLQIGGSSVLARSQELADKARRIAAHHLEANVDDVVVADGRVGVAGVPARALSWAELAGLAADVDALPPGEEPGLSLAGEFTQAQQSYPFGAHVSAVEVDSETGRVTILRHVAVDDCGRIVNPTIVRGQQHGGIAQGIAQALFEEVVHDADGNVLTGSFIDYAIPTAADLPSFEAHNTETPTPLNPLGAKGIGESGTIGSTPSVHSAVLDALAHLGVLHVDMPLTPHRVWAAIQAAPTATPV